MADPNALEQLLAVLPTVRDRHAPQDPLHQVLKRAARAWVEESFAGDEGDPISFEPFGEIRFPYFRMGAVDSMNLFDLDELILFSFYHASRERYRCVADIGANLGLHSLLLARCGFEVRSYEPDPVHADLLQANLDRNDVRNVTLHSAAVSAEDGEMEFVRVKGNTTGSHLAGAKSNPYGDLDRFPVEVVAIGPILRWADLIKLDAEGHEDVILAATEPADWQGTDAVVEVGSPENADVVFEHFRGTGIQLFAQQLDWERVESREQMPESYKHGSLFISGRDAMPWSGR